MSNPKKALCLLAGLLLCLGVQGCGQKGSLYLPEPASQPANQQDQPNP